MAKPRRKPRSSKRKTSSLAKRRKSLAKRRKQEARLIPWIVGTIVLVVIGGVLWNRSFFGLFSPKVEGRGFEELFGVTGTPYDAGETSYVYPNPAGNKDKRKWLPALGAEDAPVVVMEFSDIYCGHCRAFHMTSLEGILKDYVATGEVRYVDHYFGFPQTVADGVVEAEMCAAEQGRYFEFKHALFQRVSASGVNIDQAVHDAALDVRTFKTCRSSGKYRQAQGEIVFVDNMDVNATPTFFVNGTKIEGNRPEELRRLIDEALKATQ